MTLTEEQARTKWCPFVRAGDNPGCNRNEKEFPLSSYCIASDCMAWRDGGEEPAAKAEAEREFNRSGRRIAAVRVGFCGLAGRF